MSDYMVMRNEIRRLHEVCRELEGEKQKIIETVRDKEWNVRHEDGYRRLKEVKLNVLQELMEELGIELKGDNENE